MKTGLSDGEIERYNRNLIIPEVGVEGQEKLKAAKVLIVGAGGLGSPIGMYLAAAGVGKIGIVDFDRVNLSNLQRQVVFSTDDVGKAKAKITAQRLKELNTEIEVDIYNLKLSSNNALEIIREYDFVADGSDNFATRYLVNDACVLLGKPDVYGSILRFEGQVTVFDSKRGPCYRCLYPEPPAPGSIPSCEEAGVLGVLPGIIGSIQANEVIKYIIGKGDLLVGRLMMFDALKMKFKEITFEKDKNCPVCGDNPTITKLLDYEGLCGAVDAAERTGNEVNNQSKLEISVDELKHKLDKNENIYLLDVREPFESRIASIGGQLIPLGQLPERLDELNKDDEIVIYCHTGVRSLYAAKFLKDKAGFNNALSLHGGINAWSEKIDSSIKKY
jgi:adenylyltransferase/sulfurtransferase